MPITSRQRRGQGDSNGGGRGGWSLGWKMAGLLFAALAAGALLLDLRSFHLRSSSPARRLFSDRVAGDPQDLILGLLDEPYVDPSGLFSMVPPRGWQVVRSPLETTYNVIFQGPHGMDICVQAVEKNEPSLGAILADIKKTERKLDANLHVEMIAFAGRPAIRRTAQLFRNKVLTLDFIGDRSAHHLQFAAPPGLFEAYLPAVTNLLETYTPLR